MLHLFQGISINVNDQAWIGGRHIQTCTVRKKEERLERCGSRIFSRPDSPFRRRLCRFLHYALVNNPAPSHLFLTAISGVLQGMQSMAFCPDLATAGRATGGHNSLIDNNSPLSLHLSSPCGPPPSIHVSHCLPASVTVKNGLTWNYFFFWQLLEVFICVIKHSWVCFVQCIKRVWLSRRMFLCVCVRSFSVATRHLEGPLSQSAGKKTLHQAPLSSLWQQKGSETTFFAHPLQVLSANIQSEFIAYSMKE